MKNPFKDKIRKLESIGIMLNEFEQHLRLAGVYTKDAESLLYSFGFPEHSARFADMLGRLKGFQKDAAVLVEATLAELRLKREELRKEADHV